MNAATVGIREHRTATDGIREHRNLEQSAEFAVQSERASLVALDPK